MKNIFIASMLSSLLVTSAQAGISTGKITSIVVNASNQALVVIDGGITNTPACNQMSSFVTDLTQEYGRAMYSMLLSAQAQNKEVTVSGNDLCDFRSNAESIRYTRIAQP